MDIDAFWDRVKYLIKTHKTSQEEVARIIGVPLATLRNWIYYKRIPDVFTACRLAIVLGVSIDYLIYGKEREITEERMNRLLERKNAAVKINKLARVILDQSGQI